MNRALKIIAYIAAVCSACALIAGFCVIIFPAYFAGGGAAPSVRLNLVLYFVLLGVGLLSDSLLHELGHFFFGLISGVHAGISFRSLFFGISGYASVIPKKETGLKTRFLITASGGLAVDFSFIVLSVLALAVPQIPVCLGGLGVGHAALFFINAFPVRYSSGKTDGLVISELLRNAPESQVMLAVLRAQAHILGGKPIVELDRSVLFDLPQIAEDDPSFISLCELRAEYLKAAGDEEGAARQFARFEELKEEYL